MIPNSFSNQGGKYLAVNSSADAVEFVGVQSNQVLEMIGNRCDGDSITTLSGDEIAFQNVTQGQRA